MASHKGKPAGTDRRQESETGMPSDFRPAHLKRNDRLSRYVEEEERIADNIRLKHPNRHAGRKNPPAGGGYRH